MAAPLLEVQQALLAAVAGPGRELPAGWFAVPPDRAALAVSAHATTVRHARADALGQSFPRSLARLGRAFPSHAEAYFEALGPTRLLPQELGHRFAAYLAGAGEADAAAVAAAEWAMMRAYHAPERRCLDWRAVASAGDPLALRIALHPAAALIAPDQAVLDEFGLSVEEGGRVLVTRPDAAVLLHPVGPVAAAIAGSAGAGRTLGEAAAAAIAATAASEEEAFEGFSALVGAGALVALDGDGE